MNWDRIGSGLAALMLTAGQVTGGSVGHILSVAAAGLAWLMNHKNALGGKNAQGTDNAGSDSTGSA